MSAAECTVLLQLHFYFASLYLQTFGWIFDFITFQLYFAALLIETSIKILHTHQSENVGEIYKFYLVSEYKRFSILILRHLIPCFRAPATFASLQYSSK